MFKAENSDSAKPSFSSDEIRGKDAALEAAKKEFDKKPGKYSHYVIHNFDGDLNPIVFDSRNS